MTPSVVIIENLAATLLLTLTSLPTVAEDSLRFSFEAASGVGGGSSDSLFSVSAPASHAFMVTSESSASIRVPSLASSLLLVLALHIMTMV